MKRVYNRGTGEELAFLASCALHLLDRRYWIIGVRYPVRGTRFDIVARHPERPELVLVEAKLRRDRQVRPYEVRALHAALAKTDVCAGVQGVFMTNSSLSQDALAAAQERGIEVVERVPLLFDARARE